MTLNLGTLDISDLCTGAAVMGTGGGGSPELGRSLLNKLLEMGKEIRLISSEEVPNDAIVIHPSMVGSIAPSQSEEMDTDQFRRILSVDGPLFESLRIIEGILSKRVYATMPVELGGSNTPIAMILASLAGLPCVDGDTIGRAKPELMMQTYTTRNVPITPMVVTDFKGNSVIVKSVASFRDAERIARTLAVIWGSAITVRCPVQGKVLKNNIIPGGITKCIAIGRALREAEASKECPVQATIEAAGGHEIFRGEVKRFDWEDREGFLWGTYTVQGDGRYAGHEFKVWIKNENLISWLDEKPYVVTPDLICTLEAATGRPFTNTDLKVGKKIVAFGIPCDPFWRAPEAITLVSPKHFDFEIPYTPLEEVLQVVWNP